MYIHIYTYLFIPKIFWVVHVRHKITVQYLLLSCKTVDVFFWKNEQGSMFSCEVHDRIFSRKDLQILKFLFFSDLYFAGDLPQSFFMIAATSSFSFMLLFLFISLICLQKLSSSKCKCKSNRGVNEKTGNKFFQTTFFFSFLGCAFQTSEQRSCSCFQTSQKFSKLLAHPHSSIQRPSLNPLNQSISILIELRKTFKLKSHFMRKSMLRMA